MHLLFCSLYLPHLDWVLNDCFHHSCLVTATFTPWKQHMDLFCLICVYTGTAGNVEHGDQYQLKLVYEHNLQRTACNMTYGTFGGVTGMDDDVKTLHLAACYSRDGTVFCQTRLLIYRHIQARLYFTLTQMISKRAQLTDLIVSLAFIYKHNLRSFVVVAESIRRDMKSILDSHRNICA